MPFLRASLRQTMIRKLASVGKDKDGWKKVDDHLTTLMDQEHMITLEDTEAVVKRCEQHLQRAATDDASPKARILRPRSRDKIQRLNLRHSRRLPRIKTLKSRRYRPSCVAINRVPSVRAMASQLKRNISQCALFATNGGTMLWIVGTNWTRTKPSSTWPRRLATRRRRTCPSASRLAKKQRLTPPLLMMMSFICSCRNKNTF
jgi:hypothetical protein